MIKLIASDMDGTLLNDKMEVSDENAQAIRDAQAAGIEFMVATGRNRKEALPPLKLHRYLPPKISNQHSLHSTAPWFLMRLANWWSRFQLLVT